MSDERDPKIDKWGPCLYVAGAISRYNGQVADEHGKRENARIAIAWALELHSHGIATVVPHLTSLRDAQELGYEAAPQGSQAYADILAVDFSIIAHLDGVARLPNESLGADEEVAWARRRGKPVFYSVAAAVKYFRADRGAPRYITSEVEREHNFQEYNRAVAEARVRPVGWRHDPNYKGVKGGELPENYVPTDVRDLGRRARRTVHPSEMRRNH